MSLDLHSVTIDCADPPLVAAFWAAALGYTLDEADAEGAIVVAPNRQNPRLLFLTVPEGKAVKNRLHLDLTADHMDAEVDRVVALGARVLRVVGNTSQDTWTVLQDPEGNEFCIEQRPESGDA